MVNKHGTGAVKSPAGRARSGPTRQLLYTGGGCQPPAFYSTVLSTTRAKDWGPPVEGEGRPDKRAPHTHTPPPPPPPPPPPHPTHCQINRRLPPPPPSALGRQCSALGPPT